MALDRFLRFRRLRFPAGSDRAEISSQILHEFASVFRDRRRDGGSKNLQLEEFLGCLFALRVFIPELELLLSELGYLGRR